MASQCVSKLRQLTGCISLQESKNFTPGVQTSSATKTAAHSAVLHVLLQTLASPQSNCCQLLFSLCCILLRRYIALLCNIQFIAHLSPGVNLKHYLVLDLALSLNDVIDRMWDDTIMIGPNSVWSSVLGEIPWLLKNNTGIIDYSMVKGILTCESILHLNDSNILLHSHSGALKLWRWQCDKWMLNLLQISQDEYRSKFVIP